MAKTKISEYSATSANNTDISNINIAEGCSPANVNNAIRTLMAQLKDQQDGTSGDPFTVGGNLTVTGTTTLTGGLASALPVASGGTGATTASGARTSLSAAVTGANGDITSLTGLTTPLSVAQGGTGTASTTFANLTTNVTGTLPVANGGTGAATLTSGSVIVGAGTSTPTFVAPTTTGNVLFTTNGTTWSSTPKITSETAQATTSGTTKDFTSIPAWVKRITVMYSGLSTSGSSIPIIQFGTGGTPTYTTSGYLGTAARVTGTPSIVGYTSGFLLLDSHSSANIGNGQFVFSNLSGNNWVGTGMFGRSDSDSINVSAGSVPLGAALTAVRLTTVNGTDTFDAGSVNIMYE